MNDEQWARLEEGVTTVGDAIEYGREVYKPAIKTRQGLKEKENKLYGISTVSGEPGITRALGKSVVRIHSFHISLA